MLKQPKENRILKILKKRNKVIKVNTNPNANYFDIQDYFQLDKYSTYIFITPRSIGKSYSSWKTVIDVYEANGEYTVWMRTSDTEIKEMIDDYKRNRPRAWKDYYEIKGRSLINKNNGDLIAKFVPLSTVGNLASITGDGCFGIVYDEFLPREGKKIPSNAYRRIADFIKTIERGHLATIILTANMTTLNSDILNKWDLWIDEPVVDDEKRRLLFRYITEWENPPVVEAISTAAMWAENDANLKAFMENGSLLDDDTSLVMPRSRLGSLRWLEMFMVEGVSFTLAITDDDRFACIEGEHMEGGFVQDMTTADGYVPSKGHIRPHSVSRSAAKLAYGLESNNLVFSSHEVKDVVFRLLQSLNGKITRR